MAGPNRAELEKVLDHYSQKESDSLKLRAAEFLISNMDIHSSYSSRTWDDMQVELDTLFERENQVKALESGLQKIYDKYAARGIYDVSYTSDLQTMRADYLIHNIEMAFQSWETPYARHLSFDDFCEFLLPYRIGNEPFSDWRSEFRQHFIPGVYARVTAAKDSIGAIDLCNAIKAYPSILNNVLGSLPDYNTHLLSRIRIGTCKQYSQQAVLGARCLGLPIGIDFTPQWGTRSMGHEWNVLIQEDGKPLSFGVGDVCELGEHIEYIKDRIPPKVYRQTFGKQKESLAMICGEEEIPPTLSSPCMKDVTTDYYSCVDIPVTFDTKAPGKNRFAYLAVFDNQNWIPVSWAKVKSGKALFKGMHKNILYLPGYSHQGEFIPAAKPFILESSGNIRPIELDMAHKQSVTLSRKYQNGLVDEYCEEMVGGKFQASNNRDFSDAVDLYEIKEKPISCYQIVPTHTDKPYKYLRYLAPGKSRGAISNIEVYEADSNEKVLGNIIGIEATNPDWVKEHAFDGDPLTYFMEEELLGKIQIWVGLAFDTPKEIGKIVYLPRNDDNCIRDGELYELFYWDGKWISLGKQVGTDETYRLQFEDVPTGGLYLLRNLTKGKEERVFTYEKGKQVWW
jgi:hypothetical protein